MACVATNGSALAWAAAGFKDDTAIVLAAVSWLLLPQAAEQHQAKKQHAKQQHAKQKAVAGQAAFAHRRIRISFQSLWHCGVCC